MRGRKTVFKVGQAKKLLYEQSCERAGVMSSKRQQLTDAELDTETESLFG